jgi:hypothetical protein
MADGNTSKRTLTQPCRLQPRATLAGGHQSPARPCLYRGCIPLCTKEGNIWKATAREPDDKEQVQRLRTASRVGTSVDGTAGLRTRRVGA